MELKEFVRNFMEVNEIEGSVDLMISKISEEARKRATKGVAVLSEEDVEKVILGVKLEPIKAEPNKQIYQEKKPVKKAETKPQKAKKKEPDIGQMSLFDFQV